MIFRNIRTDFNFNFGQFSVARKLILNGGAIRQTGLLCCLDLYRLFHDHGVQVSQVLKIQTRYFHKFILPNLSTCYGNSRQQFSDYCSFFLNLYLRYNYNIKIESPIEFLSPAAPKARDGRYCKSVLPSVLPSVRPSVTFSFRTVTKKRINVFSRNFAGMCTMARGGGGGGGVLYSFFLILM